MPNLISKLPSLFIVCIASWTVTAYAQEDDYGALRQYAHLQLINKECKSFGTDLSADVESLLNQKIVIMEKLSASQRLPKEAKKTLLLVIEASKARKTAVVGKSDSSPELSEIDRLTGTEKCQKTKEYIAQDLTLSKFMSENLIPQ